MAGASHLLLLLLLYLIILLPFIPLCQKKKTPLLMFHRPRHWGAGERSRSALRPAACMSASRPQLRSSCHGGGSSVWCMPWWLLCYHARTERKHVSFLPILLHCTPVTFPFSSSRLFYSPFFGISFFSPSISLSLFGCFGIVSFKLRSKIIYLFQIHLVQNILLRPVVCLCCLSVWFG